MPDNSTKRGVWSHILRDGLLLLVAAVFAFFGALMGSWYEGIREVNLQKYLLATQFHCKTAELFNEAEYLENQLVQKHGSDKVRNGDIPQEELDRLNELVKQLNTQLSGMFLTMPDATYQNIPRAVPVGEQKLRGFKDSLLCEMRKSQFPKTRYSAPENIRFFDYKEKKK